MEKLLFLDVLITLKIKKITNVVVSSDAKKKKLNKKIFIETVQKSSSDRREKLMETTCFKKIELHFKKN